MARNAVKRVGTGIDQAIGVPDESGIIHYEGDVDETSTKSQTKRRLAVKRSAKKRDPSNQSSSSPSRSLSHKEASESPLIMNREEEEFSPKAMTLDDEKKKSKGEEKEKEEEGEPSVQHPDPFEIEGMQISSDSLGVERLALRESSPTNSNSVNESTSSSSDKVKSKDVKMEIVPLEDSQMQEESKMETIPLEDNEVQADNIADKEVVEQLEVEKEIEEKQIVKKDNEKSGGIVDIEEKSQAPERESGIENLKQDNGSEIETALGEQNVEGFGDAEARTETQKEGEKETPSPLDLTSKEPQSNIMEPTDTKEGVKVETQKVSVEEKQDEATTNQDESLMNIDPVTLQILAQAKEEHERLEKHTNKVEQENAELRKALVKAKSVKMTLVAREKQVENLSRENARLSQESSTLKGELGKSDERSRALKGKLSILESRLGEIKTMKQKLKDSENKLERQQRLLEKKDSDIKQVIKEGQKMSKKQHGKDKLIRSLRKDLEAKQGIIDKQQRELDSRTTDMKNAKSRAAAATNEAEETTSKLSMLTKKNRTLSDRLLTTEAETRKLQQLLAKAQDTIKTFSHQMKVKDSRVQKALSGLADRKKERDDIQKEFDKLQEKFERLTSLHESARQSIKEAEERAREKEESAAQQEKTLRRQMQELRKKMHDSEVKNQELGDAIPKATRPLLEQITMLTQTIDYQRDTQTSVEQRYKSEVTELSKIVEELKRITAQKDELLLKQKKITKLSSERYSKVNKEKELLEKQHKQKESKLQKLEARLERTTQDAKASMAKNSEIMKKYETIEQKLQQLMVTSRLESNKLRKTLRDERSRRKQLADRLKKIQGQSTHTNALQKRGSESSLDFSQQETEEQVMLSSLTGVESSARKRDTKENKWKTLEQLRADARTKEGEVFNLKQQLSVLEKHRKVLSDKLVELTRTNADNESRLQHALRLETEHQELKVQHSVALDLIGEKEEELFHLRQELDIVKDKFREQLEVLLDRIDALEAEKKSR